MTKAKGARSRSRAGSELRHDRAGLKGTRGHAKKGGGGGNYTWGKPGDESFIPDTEKGDPIYDSENEEALKFYSLHFTSNGNLRHPDVNPAPKHDYDYLDLTPEPATAPKLPLVEFKSEAAKAVREFFIEGDKLEFLRRIESLDSCVLHYELVKKMIVMSMEKTSRERELVSKIFIALQDWKLLPSSQLAKGFERIFETIEDLRLDIPDANTLLAQFLARCVADEVLPPICLNDVLIQSLGGKIVEHAKVLLSVKHGLMRLEGVWGPNISSPIPTLKREVKMILLEYLNSSDCTEAGDLIKKLNVPFFHHEVVKRGIVLAIERKEREQAMVSVLIKNLVQNGVVSTRQLVLGYQRLFQEVEDIKLDNPDGDLVLEIFAQQSVEDGFLTKQELADLKERATELAERQKKKLAEDLALKMEGRERSSSDPK